MSDNTLLDYSNTSARSTQTAQVYDPPNLAPGHSQHSGSMEHKPRLYQAICLQNVRWPTCNGEIHETNGFLGQWQLSMLPTSQRNHNVKTSLQCNWWWDYETNYNPSYNSFQPNRPQSILSITYSFPVLGIYNHKNKLIQSHSNSCKHNSNYHSVNSVKDGWSMHGHNTKTSTSSKYNHNEQQTNGHKP